MAGSLGPGITDRERAYGSKRMCSDACRTLSLVFLALAGALPKAKLILCSRNSSSVTTVWRDSSSAFTSSGLVVISPKNCFRSAMLTPLSFSECLESRAQIIALAPACQQFTGVSLCKLRVHHCQFGNGATWPPMNVPSSHPASPAREESIPARLRAIRPLRWGCRADSESESYPARRTRRGSRR